MRKNQSPIYNYIESQLAPEAADKVTARKFSQDLGLETISISPTEASLIQFITDLLQPEKIVEIGTLTGLSSLYFLETLKPDGKLWTFEKSVEHTQLARLSLARYIKSGQCEIVEGDATESLLTINEQGPFDVIFIDGNKSAYYEYWLWAKSHLRAGGLIFIDNVFLAGSVWGDHSHQRFSEKQIATVKKMTTEILSSGHFTASFVPTHEGLLVIRKK